MQKAGMWKPMTDMFEEFVKTNPEHQAAVAGLYWIGRAKAKLGKVEEAKSFLVEQTRKYINEPKREAVENLLTQLAQLCMKRPPPPEPPKVPAAPAVAGQLASLSTARPVSEPAAPEAQVTTGTTVLADAPEPPPWD